MIPYNMYAPTPCKNTNIRTKRKGNTINSRYVLELAKSLLTT